MRTFLYKKLQSVGITWSLLFIILLITLNFILFFYNRTLLIRSQQVLNQISNVESGFEKLWDQVQRGDLGIRGYMVDQSEQMLIPLNQSIEEYKGDLAYLENILKEQNFDMSHMAKFNQLLEYKIKEPLHMKKLVDEGGMEEAIAILKKDTGYELWKVYEQLKPVVDDFEDGLRKKAQGEYDTSMRNTMIFQMILVVLGIPGLVSVFYLQRMMTKEKNELFVQLDNANKEYLFSGHDSQQVESDNLSDRRLIVEIVNNLKKAALFIQNITKGNYDIHWDGLTSENEKLNKNNLAGELVKMRDQMKLVKDEEGRRLWANEGIAKFSEIISQRNSGTEDILFRFVSEITKYVKANQGGIFILNNNSSEPALDLKACYAFNRQKYISKTVKIGEGLVGQAFLEKDVVYLKEIPKNYVRITSGLGDAPPNNVVIIPMLYNEEVVGVLELASFKILEEYQVQLVRKVLENLASVLVSVNMNEKTKMLLEESQLQSRQLQSQEEELRQNTEELHAQQETLSRENTELKLRIEQLEVHLEETRT